MRRILLQRKAGWWVNWQFQICHWKKWWNGSQLATNCSQLKIKVEDGKMRLTEDSAGPVI